MSTTGPSTPTPAAGAPGDAATVRVPSSSGGDRLGPYTLLQVLGEGGMGVVHLAVDPRGRAVAVKVLRDHVAHDAGSRARLAREVSSLSRVQHPRVAAVLDADTTGPRPYVVTRYVPGPGLDDVVREGGPFHGAALVRLGHGLADAVSAVHGAGIVHRDLKPGNVLMVDGEPVVIDFGIAHVADDTRLTSTGLVMGTPGYLSPEVVSGGGVTTATDWWGWAATMLFAATGRPPFGTGAMPAVLERVRTGRPDVDGLEPGLRALFEDALAPDVARRPGREELLARLDSYGERAARLPAPEPPARDGAATQVLPAVVERTRPVPAGPVPPSSSPAAGVAAGATPGAYVPVGTPGGAGSTRSDGRRLPWPRPSRAGGDTGPGSAVPGPVGPARAADVAAPVPHDPARPVQALGDPRLGRPGRSGALSSLALALAALAATWPVVALVAALAWAVLARTSDRVVTATVVRRHTYGSVRRTDGVVAVLTSPLHLVVAALSTVLSGVLGAVVGLAVAFLVSTLGSALLGLDLTLWGAPAVGLGGLAALWTTWWGPGGTSLRRGSRSVMRALTPEGLGADLVASALTVAALGLLLWSAVSHGAPSYAPYGPPSGPSPVPWQW